MSITTILTSIVLILASNEQVNTPLDIYRLAFDISFLAFEISTFSFECLNYHFRKSNFQYFPQFSSIDFSKKLSHLKVLKNFKSKVVRYSECGNFRISVSLRFNVKSILENLEFLHKTAIFAISGYVNLLIW